MLLSPASCHFLPLRINYLPQYHILEQPQPTFFPDGQVSAVAKSRTLQVQATQYELKKLLYITKLTSSTTKNI